MDENVEKLIDNLILAGAVEPAGMDSDTGEMLYSFTPKIDEVFPKMSEVIHDHFHSVVMSLWTKGFVNITLDEKDPDVSLTDMYKNEQAVSQLSAIEKTVLKNIIQLFSTHE